MNSEPGFRIVRDWIEAVNRRDIQALLALSHPEIEIIGPRGSAKGHEVLTDWLARAGLSFETRRLWVEDDNILAEQHGVWEPEYAGPRGEADFVSVFKLSQGLILSYERQDTPALAAD